MTHTKSDIGRKSNAGRKAKMTLRRSPRSYKPHDRIEKMLVAEMKRTGKSFTEIVDSALAQFLVLKH